MTATRRVLPMFLLSCCMTLDEFTDADNDGYPFDVDCDDQNPDVNEGAVEVMNGIDDNCDGKTDWCLDDYDFDCDGYFRLDRGGEDCDDSNYDVNPGAEEICGDGLDNNCDGSDTPCLLTGDIELIDDEDFAMVQLYGHQDDALAGYAVSAFERKTEGWTDLLVGAPGARSNDEKTGAVYLFRGPVTQSQSLANAAVEIVGAAAGDTLGSSVYGWRNPESVFSDTAYWLIGARGAGGEESATGSDTRPGAVFLIISDDEWYKYSADPIKEDIASLALVDGNATFLGEQDEDQVGTSVLATSIDDDSYADIVIGAPGVEGNSGSVYILRGGDDYNTDLRDRGFGEWYGKNTEEAGTVLAAVGDQDGDGDGDVLIGAPSGDSCYLVGGNFTEKLALTDADACLFGVGTDGAGSSISGGFDVNGDGYTDLLIGAVHAEDRALETGAVYLIKDTISGDVDLGESDTVFYGEQEGDEAGAAVDGADIDGDGFVDLLIGAPCYDAHGSMNAGAAYLLYGPISSGTIKLTSADARFLGEGTQTKAGFQVSINDYEGSTTKPDIAISVPYFDVQNETGNSLFLFFGERM